MGIYSLATVRMYTLYIQFDKPTNQQQEQHDTLAFKIYEINTNLKMKGAPYAAANITDSLLILAFWEIFTTFLNLICEGNISHRIKIITSS